MKKTTIAWILYGVAVVLNVALVLYPTQPIKDALAIAISEKITSDIKKGEIS